MQLIRNLLLVTKPLSHLKSKHSTKTNLITRQLIYIYVCPSSFSILISTISKTLKIENTVIAVVEAEKVDSTECQIKSIWLSL